jgi:hypothetical protein
MADNGRPKRQCVIDGIDALRSPQEKSAAQSLLRRDAARAVHSDLFPDVASACRHFGLKVDSNHRNVRHHVSVYASSGLQKLTAFSDLSVACCRDADCRCQPSIFVSDDSEVLSEKEEADNVAQAAVRSTLAFNVIADMIREGKSSNQEISNHVFREFCFERSKEAIRQDRKRGRIRAPQMGRPTVLSDSCERKVLDTMKYLRASKIGFFPETIDAIASHVAAAASVQFVFGRSWRRSFCLRHEKELAFSNPSLLEDVRKRCCTSKKVARHYEILHETLLELGWADVNPAFDASVPYDKENPTNSACCPIVIRPEFAGRIISMDETRFSLNQAKEQKLGNRKMCFVKAREGDGGWADDRDVGLNKGVIAASLVGGSGADSRALPCMCIFNGGFHPDEDLEHMPKCLHRSNAAGELLSTCATSNEKGSMTDAVMLDWLNCVLVPSFPDLSPDDNAKKVLLICDGYGSHLSLPMLKRARELGVVIVLRPPHTSHLTQGEDVEGGNFSTFHRLERITKLQVKNGRELADQRRQGAGFQLVRSDIGGIIHDAWQEGFSARVNAIAWQRIGVYPVFNRRIFWFLKAEEEKNSFAIASVAPRRQQPNHDEQDVVVDEIDVDQVAVGVFPAPPPRRERANGSESCWHGGSVTRDEYISHREMLLAQKDAEAEVKRLAVEARDLAAGVRTRERYSEGMQLLPLLHSGEKVVSALTARQIDAVLTALGQSVSNAAGVNKAAKLAQLAAYMASVGLVFNAVALAVAGDILPAAVPPALPLPDAQAPL